MTARFYILPLEIGTNGGQIPKYLKHRYDPDPPGLDVPHVYMAYGLINAAIAVCEVTPTEHTELSAHSDVAAVPENIDQNIGAGAVPQVQAVLEALYIPAGWVNTSYTYRDILRRVAGLFQFAQRHKGLWSEELITAQSQLNLTWAQVPLAKRTRVAATADSFGYDYSTVTGTWTVRQTLMHLGDQWGDQEIRFYNRRGGLDVTL